MAWILTHGLVAFSFITVYISVCCLKTLAFEQDVKPQWSSQTFLTTVSVFAFPLTTLSLWFQRETLRTWVVHLEDQSSKNKSILPCFTPPVHLFWPCL